MHSATGANLAQKKEYRGIAPGKPAQADLIWEDCL
jgi:hypothetical protein